MTHFVSFLLFQLMKIPGVKYLNDHGTPFGRVYTVEFEGVKYLFYGIPMNPNREYKVIVETQLKKNVMDEFYDAKKKLNEIEKPLMFSDFLKENKNGK